MTELLLENLDDTGHFISVLLLATKWQFDTYGLSTVNKSLVNNLRAVDPEGKKIKITCAVLEEDRKIQDDQREDVEKYKVKLKGAKPPRGSKKHPCIEWLDQNIATFYPDLRENSYDFIIGHVPYLANGPLNFRDNYVATETKPKVILMIHDLPRTTDGDTDEDCLVECLSEADFVFSVGKSVESEIISILTSNGSEQQPIHKLYIPGFPLELFNIHKRNKFDRPENITEKQKDIRTNFPMAVTTASKYTPDTDRDYSILLIRNKEDEEYLKEVFEGILNSGQVETHTLYFQSDSPENFEKYQEHLRKTSLLIRPLMPGSLLFGSETLSAIAAGAPILVLNNSGISALLETLSHDQSIIQESTLDSDTETWKERMLQKLLRPEDSQRVADRMREQLLLDTSIAESHLDFISTLVGAWSIPLKVDLDSDPVVAQEHIDTANKFGIDLSCLGAPIHAKKFVLAFIRKIFMQNNKLNHRLLTDYIRSDLITVWREVLLTLEKFDRKLLAVDNESLIFTLFCPTISAAQELTDDSWVNDLTSRMCELLKKIGVDLQPKIHSPKDVTELLSKFRDMKLRDTAESEEHETRTKRSSEIGSEIFYGRRKVMEWLEKQPDQDPTVQPGMGDTSVMSLLKTMVVNQIVLDSTGSSLCTKFNISETSGSVGIASIEAKPRLLVMCPGADRSPLTLCTNKRYWSVIFMPMLSDQEYLAAASKDSIFLWNLSENTSSVAFKWDEGKYWHMSMIDERTVACITQHTPSDGLRNVYILNMDSQKCTLSSTIELKAGQQITDMCHVQTTDNTSCLLLSLEMDNSVKCVELIRRKVRWQVDEQEMGGSSLPWSICTDGSTAFILNLFHYKLHLLSVEDGSPMTSLSLYPFGIDLPSCVRLQGDHLYVGHMDKKGETYCVSKFTKPSAI